MGLTLNLVASVKENTKKKILISSEAESIVKVETNAEKLVSMNRKKKQMILIQLKWEIFLDQISQNFQKKKQQDFS